MIDLPKQFLPFAYELDSKKQPPQANGALSEGADSVFNGKDEPEEDEEIDNKPLGGGVLLVKFK